MTETVTSAIARTMTEEALQRYVQTWLSTLGWLSYHTWDSRRSQPGFPDIIAVRGARVLAIELKSETGKVRPEQQMWLDALAAAGVETHVIRPSDWLDGWGEKVLVEQEDVAC